MSIKKNVLIIAPSLNPQENISGISTVTQLLMNENMDYDYKSFIVGKKDREKRNLLWLLTLLVKPFKFFMFQKGNIDIMHFNTAFEPKALLRDSLLFVVALLRCLPIVLHIHGGRYMNRKAGLFSFLIKLLLMKSNKIIVLSEIEKQFLLSNYSFALGAKISIVPNAITIPSLSVTEKNFEKKLSILYLGRIDKAKGLGKIHDALVILCERQIPFVFHLCGVGPDKDCFLNDMPDIVKKHVIDEGLVYGTYKSTLLIDSNIYLLPSDFEGLPISLLEAMSYYVVPIVSPVGSMPDVVKNDSGFLTSNAEQIAEAIALLHKNRDELRKLACRARQNIEDKYSSTQFVKLVNEVYLSLTN